MDISPRLEKTLKNYKSPCGIGVPPWKKGEQRSYQESVNGKVVLFNELNNIVIEDFLKNEYLYQK